MNQKTDRAINEVKHGEFLSTGKTEELWGWDTPAGRERAKRRAKLISEGAQLQPGVEAIEVGCGTGMFTELFAHSGASITAIDISPDLINQAKARLKNSHNVKFLNSRFEDLNFMSDIDAIMGSSVLHHLDMDATLPLAFNMLKSDGIFCFAEPNLLNPQVFVERKFRRFFPYVSPDETAFNRWSLKQNIEKYGFVDIHIEPFDWLHPAIPERWIPLVKGIGNKIESIIGVREFAGSLFIYAKKPT